MTSWKDNRDDELRQCFERATALATSDEQEMQEMVEAIRRGLFQALANQSTCRDLIKTVNIEPTLLVVGSGNADQARDLLKAERLENGATNTDRDRLEILELPFL